MGSFTLELRNEILISNGMAIYGLGWSQRIIVCILLISLYQFDSWYSALSCRFTGNSECIACRGELAVKIPTLLFVFVEAIADKFSGRVMTPSPTLTFFMPRDWGDEEPDIDQQLRLNEQLNRSSWGSGKSSGFYWAPLCVKGPSCTLYISVVISKSFLV